MSVRMPGPSAPTRAIAWDPGSRRQIPTEVVAGWSAGPRRAQRDRPAGQTHE